MGKRTFALNGGMPLPLLLSCLVLLGLTIGFASAAQPLLVGIGILGIIAVLAAVAKPSHTADFILLSAAPSIQYLVHLNVGGLDLLSFYKFAILLLTIPAMLVYGIRMKLVYPIVALGLMVIITYTGSFWPDNLERMAPIKAFIGLVIPFVYLLIRWKSSSAERQIVLLPMLAPISIALGSLLHAVGVHQFYVIEFTGAFRVQGANIPPHLAMLAFLGFLISLIEIKRNPTRYKYFYMMAGLNFFILLATGTRGPLIASIVVVLYYLYDLIKQYFRGKVLLIIPLAAFLVVAIAAGFMQYDNLKKRSLERTDASGIDLSGRAEAWEFFLKGAEKSPVFGRGLGSSIVANDGSIYEGFVVPHNEYIRFYYDSGIVGASLLFLALLVVFVSVFKVLPRGVKPYYAGLIIGFFVYSFSDNTLSTIQMIFPFCWYVNNLDILHSSSEGSTKSITQKEVIL